MRVREDAWPESSDRVDVAARGQVVTLQRKVDLNNGDPVWEALTSSGEVVCPKQSELVFPA